MNTGRVEELLQEIADQVEVDLVEHTVFQAGQRKIYRIYIDSDRGITVDICAKYSRELGMILDLEELIEDEYVLEVSSPGTDRPLKTDKDFTRNIGRSLKLTFAEPIEGVTEKKILVAKLLEVEGDTLKMELKKETVVIPRDTILTAKVEIQF